MDEGTVRRRDLLKLAGVTAAAGAGLAGCSLSDKPRTAAAGASRGRKVKLGFMPASDAAPLFMAKELGYFAERDLDVALARQVAFAAMRDNLLNGELDAAHSLYSLPLAVAAKVAGTGTTDIKIAMVISNNGQAITLSKDEFLGAGYGNLAAAKALLDKAPRTLAHTFPGGNHDVFLRYWLKAAKADTATVKIVTTPPPQMVANMKANNMAGFSAGEPWAVIGVEEANGFTHLMTQDLWRHHPEKALIVGPGLTDRQDVLADLMAAVLKAMRWLDVRENLKRTAATIVGPAYINTQLKYVEGRLLGEVNLGAGLGTRTFTEDKMVFFRDGAVGAPRRSHARWFLAQYHRLGLLTEAPDYARIPDQILLRDLYATVAQREGIAVPDDDVAPVEIKLDGATFDPAKPDDEVKRP